MWVDFIAREIDVGHQYFQIEEFKGEITWLTLNKKIVLSECVYSTTRRVDPDRRLGHSSYL
jgi:hypothetical protein